MRNEVGQTAAVLGPYGSGNTMLLNIPAGELPTEPAPKTTASLRQIEVRERPALCYSSRKRFAKGLHQFVHPVGLFDETRKTSRRYAFLNFPDTVAA